MNELSPYSDQDLVLLLQQGSQAAYLEIYDRYQFVLQQHAYRKLGDLAEAQDILQELFFQLWDKREQLDLHTHLRGYLFTAVRNKILNHYYKQQRENQYLASLQDFIDQDSYSTDLLLREKELAELIEKEIAALPPRMQEVFRMSREQHLTHQQIADILGKSVQTVSAQIRNSLKILRLKLGTLTILLFFI
ncbi:MAG: RNA polymerase sigma-70 factor [Bacteroidota bacterium]